MTNQPYSPTPWTYEYSPYTVQSQASPRRVGAELAAFQIVDADGIKVFDTNEDTPYEVQEANARLGATAPRLLAVLVKMVPLFSEMLDDLEDSDNSCSHPLVVEAHAAIAQATGRAA